MWALYREGRLKDVSDYEFLANVTTVKKKKIVFRFFSCTTNLIKDLQIVSSLFIYDYISCYICHYLIYSIPPSLSSYRIHCVKSIQIRSYFCPVFSWIRTKYRKIRTRNNFVFVHFSRSDILCKPVILTSESVISDTFL